MVCGKVVLCVRCERIQVLATWLPEHLAACLYDVLRMFPHLVNTAHSGVRLEENEPEATILLCQKKVSRSCDSKCSYSDSTWNGYIS